MWLPVGGSHTLIPLAALEMPLVLLLPCFVFLLRLLSISLFETTLLPVATKSHLS
jgi:hypothetical protein